MSAFNRVHFLEEEGRQHIYEISERRRMNFTGYRRTINEVKLFAFDRTLLRSFIHNVNIMVIIQMALAALLTFACQYAGIYFQIHPTLFVSPLVFPLAFSINADFQRREKVLVDLAEFKAASMVWFFCMRDWHKDAGLEEAFMKTASNKIKGLIIHLREYLLTEKAKHRDFVTKVLYEDFSDIAQMTDDMRRHLPNSSALIGRLLHNLNLMCSSFERLRVVREYRSPRSIRSFTKIFIFALPILLSPYYVFLGRESKNMYSAYIVAIIVSFLFGSLQGVQDKLDDPFDGMSEDDINLTQLDDWTLQSLEATANRTLKIGRFTVTAPDKKGPTPLERMDSIRFSDAVNPTKLDGLPPTWSRRTSAMRSSINRPPWQRQLSTFSDEETSNDDLDLHPYAGVLSNLPGNATILRGGHIKPSQSAAMMLESQVSLSELGEDSRNNTMTSTDLVSTKAMISGRDSIVSFKDEQPRTGTPSSLRKLAIAQENPSVRFELGSPGDKVSNGFSAVQTIKPSAVNIDGSVSLPRGLQGLFMPPTPPAAQRQIVPTTESLQQQQPPQQEQKHEREPVKKRRFKIEPLTSSSSNEDSPLLKGVTTPDILNPDGNEGLATANVGVASYIRRESMSGKSGHRRLSSSSLRSNSSDAQGDDTKRRNARAEDPPTSGRPRFSVGPPSGGQSNVSQPNHRRMQRSISESNEMSSRLSRGDAVDYDGFSGENSSTTDLLQRPVSPPRKSPDGGMLSFRKNRRRTGSDPDVTLLRRNTAQTANRFGSNETET